MWIDSTSALAEVSGRPMLFFGSYDRNVYGLWADDHTPAWRCETGGDVCSSPAVARIAGKPAVFIHSLDDTLYGIDAASGEVLWQGSTGKLMWTHIERGDSLWASPCVALVKGKPMLFLGSYEGNLYAFRCP
jgi:outer membrane protein assembly factor BamB